MQFWKFTSAKISEEKIVANLKKYDISGSQVGEIAIDDELINVIANSQMIKDYIVALRANARQWSANTKGRSEVNHSTQKPHRQKGLGRSRQGTLAAPQYKGGGRVFAPKPKFDQHVKINKKERRLAIRSLLAEKVQENRVHVLQHASIEQPKTKVVANFLKALNLTGKRVLFLCESSYEEFEVAGQKERVSVFSDQHDNFMKSIRNLQRVEFSLACNASGYDVIKAHDLIVTEEALKQLNDWLK